MSTCNLRIKRLKGNNGVSLKCAPRKYKRKKTSSSRGKTSYQKYMSRCMKSNIRYRGSKLASCARRWNRSHKSKTTKSKKSKSKSKYVKATKTSKCVNRGHSKATCLKLARSRCLTKSGAIRRTVRCLKNKKIRSKKHFSKKKNYKVGKYTNII